MVCDFKLKLNYKGIEREFIIPSIDTDIYQNNADVLLHVQQVVTDAIENNTYTQSYLANIFRFMDDVDKERIKHNPNLSTEVNKFISKGGVDNIKLKNYLIVNQKSNKFAKLINDLADGLDSYSIQFMESTDETDPSGANGFYDELTGQFKVILYVNEIPTTLDLLNDNSELNVNLVNQLTYGRLMQKLRKASKDDFDISILKQLSNYFIDKVKETTIYKENEFFRDDVNSIFGDPAKFIQLNFTDPLIKESMSNISLNIDGKEESLKDLYKTWIKNTLSLSNDNDGRLNKVFASTASIQTIPNKENATIEATNKGPQVFNEFGKAKISSKKSNFQVKMKDGNLYPVTGYELLFEEHPNFKSFVTEIDGKWMVIEQTTKGAIALNYSTRKAAVESAIQSMNDYVNSTNQETIGLFEGSIDPNQEVEYEGYNTLDLIPSNEISQEKFEPSEAVNHSGGANGGDTFWDQIGREFGVIQHKHYREPIQVRVDNLKSLAKAKGKTFSQSWMEDVAKQVDSDDLKGSGVSATILSDEDYEEGKVKVERAVKQLGRKLSLNNAHYQYRNWAQVKYADAIYAVGKLNSNKTQVEGGTAYAVQMAVNEGKPVFVFDEINSKWHKAELVPDLLGRTTAQFIPIETPKLTKNFAGIGSREATDKSKQAIKEVYEKTFGGMLDNENTSAGSKPMFSKQISIQTYEGLITSLKDNEVFVFGSNPLGINGNPTTGSGGAALVASKIAGVQQGEKINNRLSDSGKAWGITTVTGPGKRRSVTPEQIISGISKLYKYAEANPNKRFLVAYQGIEGRNNNGYSNQELADMFSSLNIPSNIIFEKQFSTLLNPNNKSFKYTINKEGTMYFAYGNNKRSDVRATTTFEAILNGERTATTRYPEDGDYWNNTKVGDIVQFWEGKSVGQGRSVLVKVTGIKPIDFISMSESDLNSWSKLEGWSIDYAVKKRSANSRTKGFQIVYEVIDPINKPTKIPLNEVAYRWARTAPNSYEVSTKGDGRFSALNARLSDGRTIEEAYQLDIKGYRSQGNDWRLGKGKAPLISMTSSETWEAYKGLWRTFLTENPRLVEDLKNKAKGKVLTDVYANTSVSQARALAELLNEELFGSDPTPGTQLDLFSKVDQSKIKSTDSTAHIKLLSDKLMEIYGIKFTILNTTEIAELYDEPDRNFSNAKAFVLGKEIVINSDLASMAEPLHELGHMVLLGMKSTDTELYGSIIDSIQSHPRYNDIASNYRELDPDSLNDEVFVNIFGEMYKNYLKSDKQKSWEKEKKGLFDRLFDNLKNFFKRMFGIKNLNFFTMEPEELSNMSVEDVMTTFGNEMLQGHLAKYVDDYVANVNTNINNLKSKLLDSNILTQECYGV